jgi:hypothetical protein
MLDDLIASLADQVEDIIVMANNWQRSRGLTGPPVQVADGGDEQNISRWWNLGLDIAAGQAYWAGDAEWNVLVVNDDVVCPVGFVDALAARMRATSAVLAYPDQAGGRAEILHTQAAPVPLSQRITGYAFMLRGETELRADESLVWWFGDDSIDWEARERGGALLVPGIPVQHRAPDVQTNASPVLTAQAGRDRQTFINRWGKAPH